MMMHKLCRACGREMPRTLFRKRPERGPDAVRSKCAECEDRIRREKRQSTPPEERERALEVARAWKRNNRERNKAAKRAWEQANPEKVKAYTQRIQRKWRAANIELARARVLASKAKNADYYRRKTAEWAKREAHRARAKYKRYMTRKRNACPGWADQILIEEAYHLAQLRTKATGIQWHVDHIVPLQSSLVCGLHVENNLQVIPAAMNLSKSNRYWPDMPTGGAQ